MRTSTLRAQEDGEKSPVLVWNFSRLIPFLSKLKPQPPRYQKKGTFLFEKPSAHLNPTAAILFP